MYLTDLDEGDLARRIAGHDVTSSLLNEMSSYSSCCRAIQMLKKQLPKVHGRMHAARRLEGMSVLGFMLRCASIRRWSLSTGPCLRRDSRPVQLVFGKPHYIHGVESSPNWP